jgi:PEP-CTERM motif
VKFKVLGAALAATMFSAAAANAASVFTVDVWTGAPNGGASSFIADAAHTPTGAPSAEFTYTGDINWFVAGPQNTTPSGNLAGAFIPSADISGFTSPSGAYATLADFLNSSLSVAGDAYASFFRITGSYSSGTSVSGSISHENGASVYDYLGNAVYSSPSETSEITGNFVLPSGSHPFTVDYVEGNGSPSVLNLSMSGVPEPSTWAMMLMGFGGLGAAMRARRKLATATA